MNKLREALQKNAKTSKKNNTDELLNAIRGGAANSGWGKVDWTKKF